MIRFTVACVFAGLGAMLGDAHAESEPELPLTSPEVYDEVAAVVEAFGAYMTDLEGPKPDSLFDRNDPAPMYLAEEMPDWMLGWDKMDWYFHTPERNAVVEAMDYTPSNIRVRSLTEDLALATWFVWAEYKFTRGAPIGEHLRAQGLLRKTEDGWKFFYYSESPKSTMAYMTDLYEAMATPEFRARFGAPPKRQEFGVETGDGADLTPAV